MVWSKLHCGPLSQLPPHSLSHSAAFWLFLWRYDYHLFGHSFSKCDFYLLTGNRLFAFVRVAGILVNILVTVFFLSICPRIAAKNPNSVFLIFYDKDIGVGYVFIANLVQSAISFLLLKKEFFSFRWKFNGALWRQ